MATSRDTFTPNPLRPYYKPSSIGIPQDIPGTTSAGTHGLGPKNGSAAAYASSAARDMFDYGDYLPDTSPSVIEAGRRTLDDWMHKYFSILLSQPFDVAKTLLQVKSQGLLDVPKPKPVVEELKTNPAGFRPSSDADVWNADYPSDDSEGDEPAYFTTNVPPQPTPTPASRRRRHSSTTEDSSATPSRPSTASRPTTATHQLSLKRADSLLEVISQEWSKEGSWGVWKASNATFIHSLLLQTIEQWSRGLFSAMFNVPETGLNVSASLADSPYPWASLAVAVAAAVSTGLVLAPLDLVRTKLVVTPVSTPKRSLSHNLRNLPSYICPATLMIPTVLHSLVTPTINHSTPLLLRSHLGIDPVLTPATYSMANFLSKTVELFLKLPLETVLRRGQISVLASPLHITEDGKALETVVEPGPYTGVFGTMWSIVYEEGGSEPEPEVVPAIRVTRKNKKAPRKGQGFEGLWRGWRVGMWGLVGMWGARAMGGSGGAREF
ncbi:hypothetical protein HYALB_00013480 [Hymenoscyphus albidus]|uniref:Mitochondrial fusion and transport protein ugo1 n=1 Tax=Hymenoscyphus albidus TaxID=595503 RepID=A0A9N9LSV2_9HELO|nr:hypothetical protein HYALB_00013480 [Hymenoscyphus albidus]